MSVFLTKQEFQQILESNSGCLFVKFGAGWCGPCKKIKPVCDHWMLQLPKDKFTFLPVDVDDSVDLFATLRSKKIVQSVPTILCFFAGNRNPIAPDNIVVGSNVDQLNFFFQKCANEAHTLGI